MPDIKDIEKAANVIKDNKSTKALVNDIMNSLSSKLINPQLIMSPKNDKTPISKG